MAKSVEAVQISFTRGHYGDPECKTALGETLKVFHVGEEPTIKDVRARLATLQVKNRPFFTALTRVCVDIRTTKSFRHRELDAPAGAQLATEMFLFTY